MLKRSFFAVAVLSVFVALFLGCSESSTTTPADPVLSVQDGIIDLESQNFGLYYEAGDVKAGAPTYDIGEIHNRIMHELNVEFEFPVIDNPAKAVLVDVRASAKNHLLAEFPTITSVQYDELVTTVEQYQTNGIFDLTAVLTGPEYTWWNGLENHCSGATTSSEIEQRVIEYGSENGLPLPGTCLAYGLDVLIHSSEFWYDEVATPNKINFFGGVMADAGGAVVGFRISKWALWAGMGGAGVILGGTAIGAIFGSVGYCMG